MKHYIVANKRQELDVLGKLEDEGFMWVNSNKLPTEHTVSEFPHVIIADNNKNNTIMWSAREVDFERNVVFDGRKEDKMTEVKKYKVTKEFIDELVAWRDERSLDATSGSVFTTVGTRDLDYLPNVAHRWRSDTNEPIERNHRLIAIIQWLNGEDVFEVEKPHKFVIRSEKPNWDGDYWFVRFKEGMDDTTTHLSKASKFDTREEAQEWANSHQVVIEVDEEGKEICINTL